MTVDEETQQAVVELAAVAAKDAVQQTLDHRSTRVSTGTVVSVAGSTCHVAADDGGMGEAESPGVVPVLRMSPLIVPGSRVRVVERPGSGVEAHGPIPEPPQSATEGTVTFRGSRTVPNNTPTNGNLIVQDEAGDGIDYSLSGSPGFAVTLHEGGLFDVTANVMWDPAQGGQRWLYVLVDGEALFGDGPKPGTLFFTGACSATDTVSLEEEGTVQVQLVQSSGSGLRAVTRLAVRRVGDLPHATDPDS